MKKKYKWIFPAIHILASFFYERQFFVWKDGFTIVQEMLLSDKISNTAEMTICYCLSKIMSVFMILGIWKLIFSIMEKKISTGIVRLFGIIFFAGFIVIIVCWPESFGAEIDNYTTYLYSRRFVPYYWHSVFTSCFYSACLMVMPHPFIIVFLQWLAADCTIAYLYMRMENSRRLCGKGKRWVLFFFLFPESWLVITLPYRNCLFTILCIYYFSFLCMEAIDQNSFSRRKIWHFLMLSVLISVWRSEGLVLGFAGFGLLLLCIYKINLKKSAIYMSLFVILFSGTYQMQKIGNIKYYGNDYMLVSIMNQLSVILNDKKLNISYVGAQDDLNTMNEIVSLDDVRAYGLAGYRGFNYREGRKAFNQSMAGEKCSKKFIKSYMRLVRHNPIPMLKAQFNCFFSSLGINYSFVLDGYNGKEVDPPHFEYNIWVDGYNEFFSSLGTSDWAGLEFRVKVRDIIMGLRTVYTQIWTATGAFALLHVAEILYAVYIVFREMLCFFKKKQDIFFCTAVLLWLAELILIILTIPEARPQYFYPFLLSVYIIELLYGQIMKVGQNEGKEVRL